MMMANGHGDSDGDGDGGHGDDKPWKYEETRVGKDRGWQASCDRLVKCGLVMVMLTICDDNRFSMVPGRFLWLGMGPGGFSWFKDGFYSFSSFQVSFSWLRTPQKVPAWSLFWPHDPARPCRSPAGFGLLLMMVMLIMLMMVMLMMSMTMTMRRNTKMTMRKGRGCWRWLFDLSRSLRLFDSSLCLRLGLMWARVLDFFRMAWFLIQF